MSATSPSEPWRLRLLGAFGLERSGRRLTKLHSRAARLLLARLALQPQRDHPREVLATWLWPEADAATALARLRQTLSTLKATLERADPGADPLAVFQADRLAIRLAPAAVDCDAWNFEQAARRGDRSVAATLWGGEFMPGDYDDWVIDERRRLEALAEALAEALGAPLDAPASSAAVSPPVPPPAAAPVDSLPRYLTRHVGGAQAIESVLAALRQSACVVLRGPGGLGKTRLAVTAARQLLQSGEVDTARFVSWVGCQGVDAAADRLAQALGLGARPGARSHAQAVLDATLLALAGRRALLVLDNAETLDDQALALVPGLLERLPGLRLVVTSRRALDLPGVQDHPVAPLAVSPALAEAASAEAASWSPAAQLFFERACEVRPDFQVHDVQRSAIEALMRLLGGLPLAIELAAARVRTLPPARLLALFRAGGAERWRVLERRGAAALADPRHASVEVVLDASLALLSPTALSLLNLAAAVQAPFCGALAEQALMARGMSREAARQALEELSADSLLSPVAGVARLEDDPWWTLQEPVRDLLAERLPTDAAIAARAAWRTALGAWSPSLAPEWPLAVVDQSLPLMQAVLGRGAPANEVRAQVLALWPVWGEHSPPSGLRSLLDAALDEPMPVAEALRARALAADLAFAAGDREAAQAHASRLQAAISGRLQAAATDDARARVAAHLSLARAAWRGDGDAGRSRAHLRHAAALTAEDDVETTAQRLRFEATLAYEADRDPAACDALLQQALRLLQGAPAAAGHLPRALRYNRAISAIHDGRSEEALPLLRALEIEAAEVGNRRLLADVLNAIGSAFDALGRLDEAVQATRASLAEAWSCLETENALYALWNLGMMARRQGHWERAARLSAFSDRFWRSHFGVLTATDRRDVLRTRRRCRQALGRAPGQRCWDEGAALPLAAAVALALA